MLKLREAGHSDLEKFYTLMEIDFDSEELLSKLQIHRAMLKKEQELLVMYDDEAGMDLGYALVFVKNLYGYVLLKYMAIVPWLRGKGLGVEFMRMLNRRYADRQGVIAELTHFPDEDKDRMKKLVRFFSRFGYEQQPADYTISGTQADLWVKPMAGSADISAVAHRIIPDFYSRIMNPFAMDAMIRIVKK